MSEETEVAVAAALEPHEPLAGEIAARERVRGEAAGLTHHQSARALEAALALAHGIQRVDACRAPSGELLLVELEDLNPYLSLDLVAPEVRDAFVTALAQSLFAFLKA
ncbi:hypothetical protein [Streptomyces goshikiensis]|uniref:hypothetical protein n=1 Tax=Streptomyces goshikiensis TaxID=1942 RepID=UPI0036BD623D